MSKGYVSEVKRFSVNREREEMSLSGRWFRSGNNILVLLDGSGRPVEEELGETMGEAESCGGWFSSRRWFYHDAWWQKLTGEYRFLQSMGPICQTLDEAKKLGTDMTHFWLARTTSVAGGRLDRRCFVWVDARWIDCDTAYRTGKT